MSGGDKLAAQYPPHLSSGVFAPGESMSPAFTRANGEVVWATWAPSGTDIADFQGTLEQQWAQTNLALEFVRIHVTRRQEEIDKKDYFNDDTLHRLRRRAVALHNRRIEICMQHAQVEKALQRMRTRIGSNRLP